jgi:DNA (cytosine-5)-methyltransferase 1
MAHRFPYEWTLEGANFTKDKGKVFSCFACGGGSTMGYKLAGFDVLGCNEIDPKMIEAYRVNHKPKYSYLEPIQTFKLRKDLPEELYNLDILDGSPPCSSFSMSGNREKDWGKEKKFREGQAEQVLDNLFFDFIDLAKELQPKVVVAENVKGLLLGSAKEYVRKIYKEFEEAGYYCQHWLLDASTMGVPQRRERVFFVCLRKDLAEPFLYQQDMFTEVPELKLNFDEPKITAKVVQYKVSDEIKNCYGEDWERKASGGKFKYLQSSFVHLDAVHPTITAGYRQKASPMPAWSKKWLNKSGLCIVGSYPQDYNFLNNRTGYLIGMSVPPVMTAQIATEIHNQWLTKI